jgi:branched-chain amino acid aminotransferase
LVFGRARTDHMVVCDFLPDQGGWQVPRIEKPHEFSFWPDALVFHYGQQIFEGMKAYRNAKDPSKVQIFRPDRNAVRFARSSDIMGMEPVPVDLFLDSVQELVNIERDWVHAFPRALYIRPTLLPLDEGVSVRASANYRYFVIVSPVQEYFTNPNGVMVAVEHERVRACPGGVGEAKCGGNYAASMSALARAKAQGADQVMWLDAVERKYVEEVGAMNVMFVYGDKLVTPSLSGSILRGVTRESVMQLAQDRGLEVIEERLDINDVLADAKSGKLTECFLCGTAVVVTPVRAFLDRGEVVNLRKDTFGHVSLALRKELVAIQTGEIADTRGWVTVV